MIDFLAAGERILRRVWEDPGVAGRPAVGGGPRRGSATALCSNLTDEWEGTSWRGEERGSPPPLTAARTAVGSGQTPPTSSSSSSSSSSLTLVR
jgi:hypothetical protein